jgi:hypothetical protein
MTKDDYLRLIIFGLGVFVFRKECGGVLCAMARSLNSHPMHIVGTALRQL